MKLYRYKLADRELHYFYCPGCKTLHSFIVNNTGPGPSWAFDGNPDRPTFHPSLKISTSRPRPGVPVDNAGASDMEPVTLCHLFVRDGRIEFCGDCMHILKGQTVELLPIPETLRPDLPGWPDEAA